MRVKSTVGAAIIFVPHNSLILRYLSIQRVKGTIDSRMGRPSRVGRAEDQANTFLRKTRHAPEEVPACQLLGCDNEYEFRVCECVDRNHLLILDYQPLAGANLHHADLHFACCRY